MTSQMHALNWKSFEKNTLKGFFDLEIAAGELHFFLRGCSYHEQPSARWVGMPGKPYKDKEGKEVWANIVDWPDTKSKRDFLAQALAALEELRAHEPSQ